MSFDEGYGSDGAPKSPKVSELDEKQIAVDSRIFKEKYRIDKLMSNSANGIIYSGIRRSDGASCVAKQVPRGKVGSVVLHEGRLIPLEFHLHLTATDNMVPGVVKAWDFYERHSSWVLVMEKPERGMDLFEVLNTFGPLKEETAAVILDQIIKTAIALQNSNIFHRDIKDENIILDTASLETKLLDFGCGDFYDENAEYSRFSGTVQFAPPEVHCNTPYKAQPVTVWSIGALAYTLMVGDVPFESKEDVLNRHVKNTKWKKNLSHHSIQFITTCMRPKPEDRPTLKDLLCHKIFHM